MESLLIVAFLYFLPTIFALGRKVPSTGSIFVVNLLLGWTLIGWVVALAWSCRTVPAAHLEELATRRAAHRSFKLSRATAKGKELEKRDW